MSGGRPFARRPRGSGTAAAVARTALAVALPAAGWGLATHSAWVAAATALLVGLPPMWFRTARVPFAPWLLFGVLAGGTMSAAALLTGHAPVP